MRRYCHSLALLAAVLGFGSAANAAGSYSVTDLGTLGGPTSTAASLNSAGDVAGASRINNTDGNQHPFRYQSGVLTDVNSGLGVGLGISGGATGINSSGFLAVNATDLVKTYSYRVTPSGTFESIVPEIGQSFTADINNQGHVVGHAGSNLSSGGAYVYAGARAATFLNLNSLNAIHHSGSATAINNSDRVVGFYLAINSITFTQERRGFLYDFDNGTAQDLGANLAPREINDNGDIVGNIETIVNGGLDLGGAFIYRGGQATTFDPLPGAIANDINNAGDVVGTDSVGPFIYSNGAITYLNTLIDPASGFTLIDASAINEAGQIAGTIMTSAGEQHAALLTPAVPEPASLSAVLIGAALLLRQRGMR